ncbi:RNA 2',3'-cyclic phosphodiesterase [Massilia sp. Dwa41.01b]|uniref:RNA 2',3'-cyclic phosphodiesterase n=1 Tax=unclassified Massilia TaxID=2609279 RepID=UPI0015FEC350|nr:MULTISPECIES: RNA 2',3'-cyclic phosphodiesterase [unclassified Massilia]QNA90599.1 RNA 2',3'-cyclic phosphodiesterase [Massilia sp. Dwa41.01b]QNA97830.1 RNA 2',3'-cyclic phosphodiesterase [Massilia sp. Se16.2.3]
MDSAPTSVPTTRLFVALWPEPGIRHALRERRDAWDWPRGATPVHPEKLHVTLHFLGGVPTGRVPELRAGLAVPFSPFTLSLGVPKLWSHGIAVLEPHSEPPELLRLHADLSLALVALGLQPETRKFRPHVTFARRANGAVVPSESEPLTWQIDRYALVESKPGNGGGYTVLQEYGCIS